MKLAAVYFPKNTLPHVFGEDHEGVTMNLGSRHLYLFEESETEIAITEQIPNPQYIANFFDEHLDLVSAVVGQNGAGKTSLLRAINHDRDVSSKKLLYVMESNDSEKIILFNETNRPVSVLNSLDHEFADNLPFEPLFYSPSMDYDLKDANSPIALVHYFDNDLEDYFLDAVARNISLLNDSITETIKSVYHDFPSYDSIKIQVKKQRKSKFRTPYLEANFGNPNRGDVLKTELLGMIRNLEDYEHPRTFSKAEVIDLFKKNIGFLESESFTEQFTKLWAVNDYAFTDDSGYDYFHNSENFINNLEVTLLSCLLLGAVFPQTGLGGPMDFSRIAETASFKERLDLFLEMYLVNEDQSITKSVSFRLNGIRVDEIESIKNIINADMWIQGAGGVDLKQVKSRMIRSCERFEAVLQYYEYIIALAADPSVFQRNSFIFNIKDNRQVALYHEFNKRYKEIVKIFGNIPITLSLFDFIPDKKLSTGEKSILDLYSSIHHYININKESRHTSRHFYVLLLDEPDLGFQPLWKKKFINAVSKTLPILFSKIEPHRFDSEKGEEVPHGDRPSLQIIFTTHDPLTLSDIPNAGVTYLKKEAQSTQMMNGLELDRKSFGANLSDLLADSFFLDDGLIGEFAKERIQQAIDYINDEQSNTPNWINSRDDVKKVIDQIGEPYLNDKLNDMFLEKFTAYKEIERRKLQKRLDRLRNDTDPIQ